MDEGAIAGRDRWGGYDSLADEPQDAGPWHGLSESAWISRLLRGAGLAAELPEWLAPEPDVDDGGSPAFGRDTADDLTTDGPAHPVIAA